MEKTWLDFLIQFILMGGIALFVQKWFGWRKWSFVYLMLIPGVALFRSELAVLVWGVMVAISIRMRKDWRWLLVWMLVGWWWLGLGRMDEWGIKLVVVNQQRGEHLLAGENLLGRWFHNKLDLIYWLWMNIEGRISLATLFAGNQRVVYSNYLPIGFLFGWDVIFLVRAARRGLQKLVWGWCLVWGVGVLVLAIWPGGRWADGWAVAVGYCLALVVLDEVNRLGKGWFRIWWWLVVVIGGVNLWLASRFIEAL